MSAFARQWDARIAPIDEPLLSRFGGELVRESFEPWSFQGYSRRPVPVLINHDPDLHIGYVDLVMQRDGWHEASFRLDRSLLRDEAAEFVRVGMPVSVGCRSVTQERDGNNLRHRACILEEISIVGPDLRPGYKGAEIIRSMPFTERTKTEPPKRAQTALPLAGVSSDHDAAGEVIYGNGKTITRYFDNAIVAVGGKPLLRTSSGRAIRREGRDYVIDQPDGSQVIYSGAEGYREALRDGTLRMR